MTETDLLATPRPTLFGRSLALLLATAFGAMTNVYLLMSTVPLYVATGGGHDAGAGLSTGAMMFSTVLMELAVPAMLARWGLRVIMALGLLMLGVPSIALILSPGLPLVLAASLLRGAGLGVVVVVGPAAIAELAPTERRGEALGIYGIAVGIPAILGLPAGIWMSEQVGYDVVFLAAAMIALITLFGVRSLPSTRPHPVQKQGNVLAGLREGCQRRPALVFGSVTIAAGIIVTFLPLAMSARDQKTAALALLVQAAVAPFARWVAGRYGNRVSFSLLIPAVALTVAGMSGLMWLENPCVVIAAAACFGIGFGAAQNITLESMFERASKENVGQISALWNLAYDGGMGIGAVGFGLVVNSVGYSQGFALTASLLLIAIAPAWLDRKEDTHHE